MDNKYIDTIYIHGQHLNIQNIHGRLGQYIRRQYTGSINNTNTDSISIDNKYKDNIFKQGKYTYVCIHELYIYRQFFHGPYILYIHIQYIHEQYMYT